jgi:hypothetical protein
MDLKEQTVGEGRKENRWHRVLEDRNRTPLSGLIRSRAMPTAGRTQPLHTLS